MQTKTKTTTPAPKPDAQPVQTAYTAEDYHSARLHGSYANAAEIAEALGWPAEAARMRAKAQPVQAATHTPGPWEARIGGGGCSVIVNSTVQMPILVQIAPDALYSHPNQVAEAQANARLIAAAPALLAALEECITYDGALAERSHTHACTRLHAISEIARAALQLARGKTK